jgi:hypothetical protein
MLFSRTLTYSELELFVIICYSCYYYYYYYYYYYHHMLVLEKNQYVSEECPKISVVQWELVRLLRIYAINPLLRNG